ncbi:MAG: outer membrane protein transport protein [Cetobacterium sp.]|uniref:OmpP1/FadL family transporter n=1 Tax=unclassified Cetobacterium TaxID=2630983 RepID=UPI00163B9D83|nr:outer membrane protein transport protein [Cetobacterium sp. 2A]MBC2856075.1 outer membrane protein transport protein [Cetobacterium sp. 2A]
MKKQLLIASALLVSTESMAGSIDYLSQQDAEYFAHPALTGKIGASSAYYNPAGTAFLENGTYLQINNQTHFKTYKMEINDRKFESDKPSPIVPSMQLVHANNGTSYFFHIGALAGGGNVGYEGGLGTFEYMGNTINSSLKNKFAPLGLSDQVGATFLDGNKVKGSSYYVALQGGIAQKINDELSFSLGLRYVNATRNLKGKGNFELNLANNKTYPTFDIDSERTAQGFSGLLGLNYQPNSKLNIGFRYESEMELDFKTNEKNLNNFRNDLNMGMGGIKIPGTNTSIGDGIYNDIANNPAVYEWTHDKKGRRNLPAMASLGASYKYSERTTLLLSGNYYFIKDAGDDFGAYDNYSNGYEIGVGIDYILNPKWTLMAGYQYTDTGANSKTYKDTDYALNADLYGIGAKYKYSENLDLMASLASVFYHSGTSSITGIKYEKHVEAIGLAGIYKFN